MSHENIDIPKTTDNGDINAKVAETGKQAMTGVAQDYWAPPDKNMQVADGSTKSTWQQLMDGLNPHSDKSPDPGLAKDLINNSAFGPGKDNSSPAEADSTPKKLI